LTFPSTDKLTETEDTVIQVSNESRIHTKITVTKNFQVLMG